MTSLKSGSQKMSVGNRTAISAFGSITAQMTDGMTIALSQFGESGSAADGMFVRNYDAVQLNVSNIT